MVKHIQSIKDNVVLRKRITPPLWGGWVGLLLLLTACVKDPIYNTDHPDKARVTINTDWSDRGEGIDKPSTYIISTTGVKEEAATDSYTLNKFFDPGNYTFFLYNNVAQITVTGEVAKVNTVTVQEPEASVFVESLPDWLFTGSLTSELDKDCDYELPVSMHQQVRRLTLIVEPEGGSVDRIIGIKGYLTGVAGELNMATNVHSAVSNVELNFTKITGGSNADKWIAVVRLLGIAGAEQNLTGTLFFENNSPEEMMLQSDLSTELSGFNTDKKTPLTLGGQIIETPTGAGFTATILDWKKINAGGGVAK